MSVRDDILDILRREKPALLIRWPIANLALFGSVARNEATDQSDVDILMDLQKPMGFEFFEMIESFEKLLGRRVDLVDRSQIKPKAWSFITREVIDV